MTSEDKWGKNILGQEEEDCRNTPVMFKEQQGNGCKWSRGKGGVKT